MEGDALGLALGAATPVIPQFLHAKLLDRILQIYSICSPNILDNSGLQPSVSAC
jgi:hypothetical protein